MSDKEILDMNVGGMTVRELTAMGFLQWLTKKIDGLPAYRGETQELRLAVSAPPMSRSMPDEQKVNLIRKLQALNVPLP